MSPDAFVSIEPQEETPTVKLPINELQEIVDIVDPQVARDRFFGLVRGIFPEDSEHFSLIQQAAGLAEKYLRHVRRSGTVGDEQTPDFVHAYRVGIILMSLDVIDATAIAVAMVHDIFEDTELVTPTALTDALPSSYASEMVTGVGMLSRRINSGDEMRNKFYYRRLQEQPAWMHAIKLADRIDKLLSLCRMDLAAIHKEDKTVAQRLEEVITETEKYYRPMVDSNPDFRPTFEVVIQIAAATLQVFKASQPPKEPEAVEKKLEHKYVT